jgi:hypothetical protein
MLIIAHDYPASEPAVPPPRPQVMEGVILDPPATVYVPPKAGFAYFIFGNAKPFRRFAILVWGSLVLIEGSFLGLRTLGVHFNVGISVAVTTGVGAAALTTARIMIARRGSARKEDSASATTTTTSKPEGDGGGAGH